ncbi:MAG: HD-GYP domain-containing protein [Gemmatimonadetes bacterium]|nr:HD-GYP domain-containing protein [Gemmatimonadota bacterium]
MTDRRLNVYIGSMYVAAIVGILVVDWSGLTSLPRPAVLGWLGLILIGVLSEGLAIGLSVGAAASTSSITFLPLLAAVQLFGPAPAVVLVCATQVFGELVVRRKPWSRALFNVAQAVVGTVLAASLFLLVGGVPLQSGLPGATPTITQQLGPFIVFGLVFLAVNHAAVAMAITLSQGLPFRRVWGLVLSNSGASLNDILVAPIALAVAFLYVQFGIGGILVVLLPMLFIRYSYLTTSKLRDANADLLTALVKAIETRDPYTSGHSLRVSRLAQQIAEEMGLNRLTVERVRDAALLHDIGKIEAVYTDILRKPDSLTQEERSIIESHVIRGEQLLRDLSSVHEEVVRAVRHHHEREDGKGYPDGLLSDEIPIGAKIIIVCDSVDAMFSDRPYRRALPLRIVLEQLEFHRGQQFDHRVVQALVRSDILVEFAELMRLSRAESVSSNQTSDIRPPPLSLVRSRRSRPERRAHH